jgi:hypothetical protein
VASRTFFLATDAACLPSAVRVISADAQSCGAFFAAAAAFLMFLAAPFSLILLFDASGWDDGKHESQIRIRSPYVTRDLMSPIRPLWY